MFAVLLHNIAAKLILTSGFYSSLPHFKTFSDNFDWFYHNFDCVRLKKTNIFLYLLQEEFGPFFGPEINRKNKPKLSQKNSRYWIFSLKVFIWYSCYHVRVGGLVVTLIDHNQQYKQFITFHLVARKGWTGKILQSRI